MKHLDDGHNRLILFDHRNLKNEPRNQKDKTKGDDSQSFYANEKWEDDLVYAKLQCEW